ncbi:PASTA domain-containing protein [Marinoscillum furvescens]|uniref:Beta-lactam-binding protein with PASTA domain n=1 Tax=Marinoscillum furvescens DSM 4134 TaxID=1122208 RepID=A0A3D9L0W7_MARFU|nr:PASTA domain-containing protein [Marinoscillum furvescens]RED96169.1 beta-lactam-binding protein with PASTA domain [Marinoscillum furvescens DSM 4134]
MSIFKINSWKDLLLHVGVIVTLGVLFVFIFFFVYLPMSTNHGETITVPDVTGVHVDDLDEFLEVRNLRFEVQEDSGFSADLPPLTVLHQFPLPSAKVKENRKIYVSLNAEKPPLVRMPKLVGGSVKNAQFVLKTYDLNLGEIKYVPDLALNYVLEQRLEEREVLEGERIPKGSTINLVVGDGLGKQTLESPNLIGLDLESAQFAIVGSGLKIGEITHEKEGVAVVKVELEDGTFEYEEQPVAPGAVFKQRPTSGRSMRLGQMVDLWIYSPDSLNTSPTLLDQE